jgi:predicted transcriptional regulator
MKEVSIKVFGDVEYEAVEILHQLGLSKRLARLLIFLDGNPTSAQDEISKGVGMQQPQVSMGLREGLALGWVAAGRRLGSSPGRPELSYMLIAPLSAIIAKIETEWRSKQMRDSQSVAILKEQVSAYLLQMEDLRGKIAEAVEG